MSERANDNAIPDDLIPAGEVRRLLPSSRPGKRLAPSTVFRWIQSGRLPAVRRGRYYFVRRQDVLALLEPVTPRPKPPRVPTSRSLAAEHRRALEVLKRAGIA